MEETRSWWEEGWGVREREREREREWKKKKRGDQSSSQPKERSGRH